VRRAAAEIPAEVSERLDTGDKLSDEDRETIIEIARQALEGFSPEPESKTEPEQETEEQPNPEAKAEPKPEPESKPEAQTGVKPESKGARKGNS